MRANILALKKQRQALDNLLSEEVQASIQWEQSDFFHSNKNVSNQQQQPPRKQKNIRVIEKKKKQPSTPQRIPINKASPNSFSSRKSSDAQIVSEEVAQKFSAILTKNATTELYRRGYSESKQSKRYKTTFRNRWKIFNEHQHVSENRNKPKFCKQVQRQNDQNCHQWQRNRTCRLSFSQYCDSTRKKPIFHSHISNLKSSRYTDKK